MATCFTAAAEQQQVLTADDAILARAHAESALAAQARLGANAAARAAGHGRRRRQV